MRAVITTVDGDGMIEIIVYDASDEKIYEVKVYVLDFVDFAGKLRP